ncbi:hypothetical protein PG1C_03735 [Rugosibacter aromaticivorans]|uniref:Uncharacterized protein n=1 Tax=Rugosibacter aromaticivorans TaxID=1565605 RepID=A0A0C5IYI8_9PROT|nr:hypothetical protein PG1C_03735 [Rugosibacter aromaticivorans]
MFLLFLGLTLLDIGTLEAKRLQCKLGSYKSSLKTTLAHPLKDSFCATFWLGPASFIFVRGSYGRYWIGIVNFYMTD